MIADYIVVGAGLTGATIARTLADAGRDVIVVEQRGHLAGNVHDHMDSGIRVQTYGPHCFRTASEEVWKFVQRFGEWYPFEARLLTYVNGKYETWPPLADEPAEPHKALPKNFEEAVLQRMSRKTYENYVYGYTRKQWGVEPRELLPGLATRVRPRADARDTRLSQFKYQALPREGFTKLVEKMLDGIRVLCNTNWLQNRDSFHARKRTFFTGAIDELFDCELGKLHYRAQKRKNCRYNWRCVQPYFQVNCPSLDVEHIRTIEWQYMMEAGTAPRGLTILTTETPYTPTNPLDYEYPFPSAENHKLYTLYRAWADAQPEVVVCGRLGEYRYLDMDQAIARALMLARKELARA